MIILIGTKAQLIKMIPVFKELDKRKIHYKYLQTDQHPKMNAQLERDFHIKSTIILSNDCKMEDLKGLWDTVKWWIDRLLFCFRWRWIFKKNEILIIHGDTMSTLLGLIVGKLFHLRVALVEAGHRSYSLLHPFPEEIIRRLACKFSDYLFAPSDLAYNNLKNEKGKRINTYQNTIFDLLKTVARKKKKSKPYIIATIHRQETLYNPLLLCRALRIIVEASRIAPVKFVCHSLIERKLKEHNLWNDFQNAKNIELCSPIPKYTDFINLIINCLFVITDGCGLQEETYFLNKPCLLMRKKTERRVGLGETAFLSKFDCERADYFFEHWQGFKRKQKFIHRNPSKIIVDYLQEGM